MLEPTQVEEVEGQIILPAAVQRQQEAAVQVESAVRVAIQRAEAVEVRDPAEANSAAAILKDLTTQKRNAEATRKELVGPLNETVKKLNAKFKTATEPLDAAAKVLRGKIEAFQEAAERARREQEERLQREAAEREAKLKAEREKAERAAREEREAAEAIAREAEAKARAAAQKDADSKAAQAALLEAEEAAELVDETKLAESTLDALPDLPAPVPVVPEAPRIEGIQKRMVWKATVTAEALVPREYLVVDQKAINQAMRDGVRDIPGVDIRQVPQAAVR